MPRYKKNYIKEIKELVNKNEDYIKNYFRNELKDPYMNYDLTDLKTIYKELSGNEKINDVFLGGLGFLIFTVAAEKTTNKKYIKDLEDINDPTSIANFILSKKQTYEFIKNEYKINGIIKQKPDSIEFHRSGTTSFILKLNFGLNHAEIFGGKYLALKILKYRYIDNRTINDSTKLYKENYGKRFRFMPDIYKSDQRFILMEFVEGMTLDEYIHSNSFKKNRNKDNVIKDIFLKLCYILEYFAKKGIIHGDLNPKNIILSDSTIQDFARENYSADRIEISLIDFGVNYLLNEKIGSSRALTRARVYIAEEVLEDFNNVSIMSDIYSLGVILLELYNVNEDFEYREFDNYLDNIRLENPVLASILDDILNKDPRLRLFDIQHKYTDELSRIYLDLSNDFELEFNLRELRIKKKLNKFSNLLVDLINLFTFDFKSIVLRRVIEARELFKIRVESDPKEKEYNFRMLTRKLGLWSFVAVLSHLFVIAIFIIFTKRWIERDKLDKLPGLVVCLSFSFLALKYYIEIFSNIYPKYLNRLGKITNLWMRFCTLYWPPAIIFVYYFNPSLWPFVSFYGTAVVVVNNYLCYKLGKIAEYEIEKTFKQNISKNTKRSLEDFKGWWQLMAIFSLSILALGTLLISKILQDEIAYAVIVIIVNFKLYKYNCIVLAPHTRNTLQFFYSRYYRAIRYRDMENHKIIKIIDHSIKFHRDCDLMNKSLS